MHTSVLLLFFAFLRFHCYVTPVTVSLSNGSVRGSTLFFGFKPVSQFLGIPYAEPPLDHLRFSPPRFLQAKWKEPLLALTPPPRCPQVPYIHITMDAFRHSSQIPKFDEDCLFLNIWAPQNSEPKPVMVWIHGSAFKLGDGFPNHNGLALAASEDVVVVILNYRLGVLGFLHLDESISGNWGLMDQQMALRWLHENVAAFGGDPEQVMLFGESAGGSSVAFHLFNTESARLFRRGVVQSASAFSYRAMNIHKHDVSEAHKNFAKFVGCDSDNVSSMVKCMRQKSASDLVERQMEFSTDFIWSPVMDGKFIQGRPEEMKPANKEVMLGVCEDEGSFFLDRVQQSLAKTHPGNNSLTLLTDAVLNFILIDYFPRRPSAPTLRVMRHLVRSHAAPHSRLAHLRRLADALGNAHPRCAVNKMADHLANAGSTVFVFEFAHRPSFSRHAAFAGATHWDDVAFVFDLLEVHPTAFNATEAEKRLARSMMREMAAFARSGRPSTSDWRPFTVREKEFFRFAMTSGSQKNGFNRDECALWTEMLPEIEKLGSRQEESKAPAQEVKFWLSIIVFLAALLHTLAPEIRAFWLRNKRTIYPLIQLMSGAIVLYSVCWIFLEALEFACCALALSFYFRTVHINQTVVTTLSAIVVLVIAMLYQQLWTHTGNRTCI